MRECRPPSSQQGEKQNEPTAKHFIFRSLQLLGSPKSRGWVDPRIGIPEPGDWASVVPLQGGMAQLFLVDQNETHGRRFFSKLTKPGCFRSEIFDPPEGNPQLSKSLFIQWFPLGFPLVSLRFPWVFPIVSDGFGWLRFGSIKNAEPGHLAATALSRWEDGVTFCLGGSKRRGLH